MALLLLSLSVLRKLLANVLMVLTVLPFTAPFPTCDVATMFGGDTQALPHQAPLGAAALADASLAHALPLVRPSSRVRFVSQCETTTGIDPFNAPSQSVAHLVRVATHALDRVSLTALRI